MAVVPSSISGTIEVTSDDFVTVGRIVRPQGNRGEVVVASETDFGETRFGNGSVLQVRSHDRVSLLTVTSSRPHDGRWVVAFAGVGSIDEAEALRGAELTVPSAELSRLESGGYYVHDLIGCRVDTTGGIAVGRVRDVQLDTGVPLLVIDGAAAEVLVPFTDAICRRVEIGARLIVIDPPEGLLDLNATGRE